MKMHVVTCLTCGTDRPRIYIDSYGGLGATHYTCSSHCRSMLEFGTTDEPRTEPGNLGRPPAFARR